jgi:hypothetical protein
MLEACVAAMRSRKYLHSTALRRAPWKRSETRLTCIVFSLDWGVGLGAVETQSSLSEPLYTDTEGSRSDCVILEQALNGKKTKNEYIRNTNGWVGS